MREDNVLRLDSIEDLPMAGLLEEGHAMLNKHRLSEAEEFFHQALERTNEPLEPRYKHYVLALLGLAEVYWKKGRNVRQIDLEWQRMYLLALSAHRKAVECCQKAILELHDNKAITWFKEQKLKAVSQHHVLETHLVQNMHENILKQERINKYFGPKSKCDDSSDSNEKNSEKEPLYLNLDWLTRIEKHYKEKCASQRFLRSESREEIIIDEDPPYIPMPPKQKKVNFEKVQTAIQRLVKHISEMGTYKIHPKMTPEEKLMLVSPYTTRYDLFKDFTRALGVDDSDSQSPFFSSESGDASPQLILDADDGPAERYQTLNSEIDKKKVIEHPAPGVERFPISWNTADTSSRIQSSHLTHSYSAPYIVSKSPPYSSPTDNALQNGVLTIWRRYENELPKPKPFVAYKLHTYEEFSPVTEVVATALMCGNGSEDKETCEENKLPDQSPVSEASISLSMALSLCTMADKLRDSNRLLEAIEVYKHSLGILQNHSGPKRAFLTHMATILQRLGVVKVSMGDFAGGSQLLEECIILLENSDDREKYPKTAQVWLELGKACMADEFKSATLNEKIMLTVKDLLQREVKHEPSEISDDVSEDEDDSECGDSYSVCIQEAITFFQNALSMLRNCKTAAKEYTKLFVDVLIHFGDCLIMNGDFDSAILYYEEALQMFRSYAGVASIESNAHVMSMLATANFLLCNYSKAISLYECANVMYQHLYGEKELANFDMAFALTMVGISYHCMTHYHRCIQWCLKAFEAYTLLFKDKTNSLKVLDRWFITETLYTLGYSYGTLNFHDNAMFYLDLAHKMLEGIADADIKQDVKILKAMADEFATLENNEKALEYYNEALNKSMILGDEESATALQNQLLNRMAGIHINTKDYSTAAEYLKKALDYQKNVQHTIQFDMIDMLRKLGVTYTLSGDIDKAIDCYTECVEELVDKSGLYKSDLVQILGNLGTLYHVKACIQDSNEEMIELLLSAEQHYQEALDLDPSSTVCVQYANYLYQQAQAGDALLTMLPYVHIHSNKDDSILTYHGVEQAVLPEHIQQDVDDVDELSIDTPVFAKFLALLCYKQLHLMKDADDCLLSLVHAVNKSDFSLNHSMLAYALMEMGMFDEAALSFRDAAVGKHQNDVSMNNCWLALGTEVYHRCARAFKHIYEATNKDQIINNMMEDSIRQNKVEASTQKFNEEEMYEEEYVESGDIMQEVDMKESIRDSGYYDNGMERLYPEADEEYQTSRQSDYSPDDIELPEHFRVMSASTVAILKQIAASKESLVGSLAASGQSGGSKPSLFSSRQSLLGSRQSLTTSHQSLNRSDAYEDNTDLNTNMQMDRGYFSSEYLESQGLDEHDYSGRHDRSESPVTFTLSGVPEDDENQYSDEYIHMEEETVETPIELLELLQKQQEEAIEREAEIFGEILNPAEKTPQNEPDYMNEPVCYEDPSYGQWRGLNYSSRNNSLNQISDSMNGDKRKSSSASEEWVTTEEEVETPLAILSILERLRESNTDMNKSNSSPNIYSEVDTQNKGVSNSRSEEWHTREEWRTSETKNMPSVMRSMSNPPEYPNVPESRYDEIPMETSPVRENPPSKLPWQDRSPNQSTTTTTTTPFQPPTTCAIRPTTFTNNNNEFLKRPDRQPYGSRTSQANYRMSRSTSDEHNGNHKRNDQEMFEEWEEWVTEETVETPPEILAVLAQQRLI